MKRTLITFALLTSSVFASEVIDQGLQDSRLKMRESITSLTTLQSSRRIDDIQKMKLRKLNQSLTKSYQAMELMAISSAEAVLESNFGIKVDKHPRIRGSFIVKKNPKMNDLVSAKESDRQKAIVEATQIIDGIESLYKRYQDIEDFNIVIAQVIYQEIGDRSSKLLILNNIKKEIKALSGIQSTKDQLAKDHGLRVKSINGEYFWDSEALKAKTGYSSFDQMPEDVLKTMKAGVQKYVDSIGDMMVKFDHFEVISLGEQTLVSDLYFRIENL